ncbi:MAG: divalent-cation tolerance protein CutA [Acidobacteria bacterium]|nr:divalent-cation tolerance protein CutA [Acidobacteriota bacterium]
MLIVLTTCPAQEAAEALAEQIVEARLAACVQVLPQMISVYIWEGAVQKEAEFLLLIKTLPEKWDELGDFITEHHSYDVPEIVAICAANSSTHYRAWMEAELKSEIVNRKTEEAADS